MNTPTWALSTALSLGLAAFGCSKSAPPAAKPTPLTTLDEIKKSRRTCRNPTPPPPTGRTRRRAS